MIPLARSSGRPSAALSGILLCLGLCGPARAVITFERTYPLGDIPLLSPFHDCVEILPDRGFLLCGMVGDSARAVAAVARLDSLGDTVWRRQFGPAYPYNASATGICRTHDGNYVFCGTWTGPDVSYPFLAKTDTSGSLLWMRLEDTTYRFNAVCATHDSGSAITGSRHLDHESEMGLFKMSKDGELQWVRVYPEDISTGGTSVQQTRDLGYVISGNSRQPVVVKTDSAGDTAWVKYFDGFVHTFGTSACSTRDGGYVQCGDPTWGESGAFVWKLDSVGNELWRTLFPTMADSGYRFYSVAPTADGGCAVMGDLRDYSTQYQSVICLVRFDSLGETLWTRRYDGLDTTWDQAYCGDNTADRGFVIVGVADAGHAGDYLVKTDSLGLVYAGVEERRLLPVGRRSLAACPNPFRAAVALSLSGTEATPARIYDNSGRLVRTLSGAGRWTWDGRDETGRRVSSGIYFCRVATETGEAGAKLVIE